MINKFPFYKQLDRMDCGPTCLKMIAKFHGKVYDIDYLRNLTHISQQGVTYGGISEAAEKIGLQTLGASVNFEILKEQAPLPCIVQWRQRHFIIVYKITKDTVHVADPAFGLIKYSYAEFLDGWLPNKDKNMQEEAVVLLLEPTPKFHESEQGTKIKKHGFSFLFPYFKPYHRIVGQVLLGLFLVSLLQLAFPFLTQSVVDYGINYQNLDFVYLILIAQIVFFVSRTAVQMIRDWLMLHMTSRINISLLSTFLMKLMRLSVAYFNTKNTGDLLQRIRDHQRVQNFLSTSSFNALFSVIHITAFSFILAYYNSLIFLVFSIGTLIYLVWTLLFLKRRKELDYKHFDLASGNQSSVIQLLNGMQEIKLNGSERRRRWEWETIQARLYKVSIKSLSLQQIQNNGGLFVNELKNIFITFIAAKLVLDGSISLGAMLAIQYILGQLNVPVVNLIEFVQTSQDAKLSLERIVEIHKMDEEEEASLEHAIDFLPENKSIHIQNLSFQYGTKNSAKVLENLEIEIPEGKVTAIVGASGSGKTTFLKHLLKVLIQTEGSIRIGNTDLRNFSTAFWRKKCGSVMQDGYIFSDSIVRNITESDSEGMIDRERLLQAVKIANLENMIERLPMGYNTRIGKSGMQLSGGQNQRILIARAVYKNPDYLFFDEATSALDATNESQIMDKLNHFFENRTVVVVAHRLSTVKNADNIIVLDQGKIAEVGTHKELALSRGIYYELVKNQLELGG